MKKIIIIIPLLFFSISLFGDNRSVMNRFNNHLLKIMGSYPVYFREMIEHDNEVLLRKLGSGVVWSIPVQILVGRNYCFIASADCDTVDIRMEIIDELTGQLLFRESAISPNAAIYIVNAPYHPGRILVSISLDNSQGLNNIDVAYQGYTFR